MMGHSGDQAIEATPDHDGSLTSLIALDMGGMSTLP
jgi:hypothetical protein